LLWLALACSEPADETTPEEDIDAFCGRQARLPCSAVSVAECSAGLDALRVYADDAGCLSQLDALNRCMSRTPLRCDANDSVDIGNECVDHLREYSECNGTEISCTGDETSDSCSVMCDGVGATCTRAGRTIDCRCRDSGVRFVAENCTDRLAESTLSLCQ
jgi:hypothetical protein